MNGPRNSDLTVLVVGATGSVGRPVVAEAVRRGHRTRALVRRGGGTASFPDGVESVVGDLTDAASLGDAVRDIDAVVFTHGSHGGAEAARAVDYGAVCNTLDALGVSPARVALMTAIGVTNHSVGHDWKRRSERLVRASGRPYTIVRPGWFDYNEPDQLNLQMLQGDRRWAGDPSDGVISRAQIAQVLVASLTSDAAERKTFELVAESGPAPTDLDPLFESLEPDVANSVDGVHDTDNMPIEEEPAEVHTALAAVGGRLA